MTLTRDNDRCSTAVFSLPIVQLAATASMAALRAVARDRLAPTIDPLATHKGWAPARTTDQTSRLDPRLPGEDTLYVD
jgi:hypothetical protein